MPLSNITSSDIPTIVRGARAAADGLPRCEHETDLWKEAYDLHLQGMADVAAAKQKDAQ